MYSTCNKRLHQPNRRRCRRNMWHPCKVLFSCLTSDPIHTSSGRCWISYSFLRMGMYISRATAQTWTPCKYVTFPAASRAWSFGEGPSTSARRMTQG